MFCQIWPEAGIIPPVTRLASPNAYPDQEKIRDNNAQPTDEYICIPLMGNSIIPILVEGDFHA
jgi:hypothetical protein